MKQQARTKQHSVRYRGWTLFQTPWRGMDGRMYYAKWLFDPAGQERLHAGYAKYCSHKELRRLIRIDVDELIPALMRRSEEGNK